MRGKEYDFNVGSNALPTGEVLFKTELEAMMARIKSVETDEVVEKRFSWAVYTSPNMPDLDEAPDPVELVGYEMVQDRVFDEPDDDPDVEVER